MSHAYDQEIILKKDTMIFNGIILLVMLINGLYMLPKQFLAILIDTNSIPLRSLFIVLFGIITILLITKNSFKIDVTNIKKSGIHNLLMLFIINLLLLLILSNLNFRFVFYTVYESFFIFFIALFLSISFANINFFKVEFNKAYSFFSFLMSIIIIFASLQHLTNSGIVPLIKSNFYLPDGSIRVFSFFDTPKILGVFSILLLVTSFFSYKQKRNIFAVFMILCSLYVIYITKIRGIHLLVLLAVLFYIWQKILLRFLNIKKTIFITLLLTILFITYSSFYLYAIAEYYNNDNPLLSTHTLVVRLEYWKQIFFNHLDFNLFNIFFGFGIIQNDGSNIQMNTYFPDMIFMMDNTYIQLFCWGGLLLTIAFVLFYIKNISNIIYLYEKSHINKDLLIVLTSFSFSFLFEFLVARSLVDYFLIVVFPILILLKYYQDWKKINA